MATKKVNWDNNLDLWNYEKKNTPKSQEVDWDSNLSNWKEKSTPKATQEFVQPTTKNSGFLSNLGNSFTQGVGKSVNVPLINLADLYFKTVDKIPGIDTTSQQDWLQKMRDNNQKVMVDDVKVDKSNAGLLEKGAYFLAEQAPMLLPANILGKATGATKAGQITEGLISSKLSGKLGQYAGTAAREGIENAAYGITDSTLNGNSASDTLKTGAVDFLGGATLGAGIKGLGELMPKWKKPEVVKTESKPVNNVIEVPKTEIAASVEPTINNAKIEGLNDPLSLIDGISVGNVPKTKGDPLKVNYSKMDSPKLDGPEVNINLKETNDTISNDFNVTAAPNQKIVTGTNQGKSSFKDKWETAYNRMIDVKKPIDKVSKESYIKATNSANSGSTVDYVLNDALVDNQGKKIGESLKKTLETNIPKGQEVEFWEYALQRHNVGRATQEKPVYFKQDGTAYTPMESQARVQYLEQQHPEWKDKAANISKWIDNFMKEWGVKSGTIDKGVYDELRTMYPDYLPTNRGFNDLEDFLPGGSGSGSGFVDQSAPIKKATGSERDIIDPTESIMNLVNRTIRTAKYNEVGQSVVKAVRQNPAMSKLAEIVSEPKGNVDNVVKVLEDGQPVYLKINDKNLLGALKAVNQVHVDGAAKLLKDLNTTFKSLITTKNPVFAIRNMMRDIPTYLINSKETNPVKLVGNLGGAVKDIVTNSPTYQQYRALGGGGSNFLHGDATKSATQMTGRVPIANAKGEITGYKDISPLRKGLNALGNGVEKFNNVIESAPRLAEFKSSIVRGESLDQAMFDAADVTTNFSRGGDIAKQIDVGVPYFNAAMQGLDKLGRQVISNPLKTLAKGAAAVTAPAAIANYVNNDNPNYQALDNRTKDNYFLIPNTFGEKDESGNAKTFIKIPKSREYGVMFGSLIERAMRQQAGEDEAFKGFKDTLKTNFAPANPIEDNLLIPAINIAIGGNKDFANRDIVPRAMTEDGRSKYLQYDEKTSEVTKKIAEVAASQGIDLSPKQMDYLIKSYLGVIAQLGLPATTKNTMEGGNTAEKVLKPVTSQFVADPLYSNQGLTDFYDKLDKSKQLAADKNLLDKIDSKTVTNQEVTKNALNKVSTEISALSKQLKLAEAQGDKKLVTQIRLKMLQLSQEANSRYKDVK